MSSITNLRAHIAQRNRCVASHFATLSFTRTKNTLRSIRSGEWRSLRSEKRFWGVQLFDSFVDYKFNFVRSAPRACSTEFEPAYNLSFFVWIRERKVKCAPALVATQEKKVRESVSSLCENKISAQTESARAGLSQQMFPRAARAEFDHIRASAGSGVALPLPPTTKIEHPFKIKILRSL